MKLILIFFPLITLLFGCATRIYQPEEYIIKENRIPNFQVKGNLSISSIQTDKTPQILWSATGNEFITDYSTASNFFANHLTKEIKNRVSQPTGKRKSIEVKITDLKLIDKVFHFVAWMEFEIKLEKEEPLKFKVSNGTPDTLDRALDGVIAIGVIETLKNKQVVAFLKN